MRPSLENERKTTMNTKHQRPPPLLGGRSPLSDPVNGDLKLPTSKTNS